MNRPPRIRRREALLAAAAAAWVPGAALAQGRAATPRVAVVAQLFDTSQQEQDVAKDFVIGSRAAWQDIFSQGGLRGRPLQHVTVEVDGSSPDAVRQAWLALRDNPACVAVSGTVSDPLAGQLNALMRADGHGLAHVAPWLQNSTVDVDDRTFPIFAARQEQIGHALKSLTVIGVNEVGAVFASKREHDLYREDVARTAAEFKLKLATYRGNGTDLTALGQRMGPSSPALLLFVGGTPELVQFTQGLDKQARQRYVIALADVNLQTVQQMGGSKSTPIIATQAVPMVTAGLPVVRRYREVMAKLFDEPPVALSLAGFIAARYTYEVLAGMDGAPTRASVLAAFQRRAEVDVGGYRVSFNGQRRSATFVTQSMLTADGRVVG